MSSNLDLIEEKLRDERSKRVVFVAHCILNENTRYLGGAFRKGIIHEWLEAFLSKGYGVIQMKCVEQKAWGGILKKNIWIGLDLKHRNRILYRLKGIYLFFFILKTKRIARKIAKEVISDIKDYLDANYEVVGIVGIDGSPVCGINNTVDIKRSVEVLVRTSIKEINRDIMNKCCVEESLVKGRGIFIQTLHEELAKHRIKIQFHAHDMIDEMNARPCKAEL